MLDSEQGTILDSVRTHLDIIQSGKTNAAKVNQQLTMCLRLGHFDASS